MAYGSKNIDVKFVIYQTAERTPLVGFDKADSPDGWLWGVNAWDVEPSEHTLLPILSDPSVAGVPPEYWQSGIAGGDDLKLRRLIRERSAGEVFWRPEINHGHYFVRNKRYFFYSDSSIIQNVDNSENVSSRNRLTLSQRPDYTFPISATTFFRTSEGELRYSRQFRRKVDFTGSYSGSSQNETRDSRNQIIWANVDTYKYEFVVDDTVDPPRLQFNNDHTFIRGRVCGSFVDTYFGEEIGRSNGQDNQIFLTNYFPILDNSDLHIYVVDRSGAIYEEYTKVTSINEAHDDDKVFMIDPDYGKIIFGDGVAGYVPPAGHYIVGTYRATIRVEYEVEGTTNFAVSRDVALDPLHESLNRGFVFLSHKPKRLAGLNISVNKASIGGLSDKYGPIYVGSGNAMLTVSATTSDGGSYSNLPVAVEFVGSLIGKLKGRSIQQANSVTNMRGRALVLYSAPHSTSEMGYYITSLTSPTTLTLPSDVRYLDVNEVYLFEVKKDDPMSGKAGADTTIGETEWTTDPKPNGRKIVVYAWDAAATHPVTGATGAYMPVRPASISSNVLTYGAGVLSTPYPDDDDPDTLGAYFVIGPQDVGIRAVATCPYSNATVISNIIYIRLEIPEYMKGVYVAGTGEEVPYGFRFADTSIGTMASKLDGVTFLTINPVVGAYDIIEPISGTPTGESVVPFYGGALSFKFTVTI